MASGSARPPKSSPGAKPPVRTPGPSSLPESISHGHLLGSLPDAAAAPTPGWTAPVDHDSLAKAIRRSIGHDGMRPEDARTVAAHVLNFFGFNERIIDNVLEPDDRDTFYMLEDRGILETERDETTLYDGREWRIHYWMICKERIVELADAESRAMAESGEKEIVYSGHVGHSYTFRLPHGESGTGLAAHAVYHELGDDIWLERRPDPGDDTEDDLAAEIPVDPDVRRPNARAK